MQDFFITQIGGLAWNVGEDAIERFILSRVRPRDEKQMVAAGVRAFDARKERGERGLVSCALLLRRGPRNIWGGQLVR